MAFETAPVRGVEVHYGTRTTDNKFGGDLGTKNGIKQMAYTYDALDTPAAGADNLVRDLPAYAKVLRVYTEVVEEVTLDGDRTGATVQVVAGSYDSSADALSAVTRGGFVIDETPTMVGTSAAEVVVTLAATGGASGNITGGKLRTIVEYIDEGA